MGGFETEQARASGLRDPNAASLATTNKPDCAYASPNGNIFSTPNRRSQNAGFAPVEMSLQGQSRGQVSPIRF